MKARLSLYLSAFILLTILAVTLGCSKAPTDTQIATDIQNKLNTDSGLQGKQLIVQADKGSVTLSGEVDNNAERDAAARYASSEPGVKQIVNNLEVAPPPPMQAQIPPRQQPVPAATEKHRRKESRAREHNSVPAPAEIAQIPPAPAALTPPHWRPLAYAGATIFGALTGLLRMSFGGHFLSDVIAAGIVTFLTVWLLYALLYRWPATRMADEQVDAALTRAFWPLYRFRLRVQANLERPRRSLPQRIVEAPLDD